MPDHPCRCQRPAAESAPPEEPAMRRWPHPAKAQPAGREDAALHYIRTALSYQNQTLADIKALLERVVLELEDREQR